MAERNSPAITMVFSFAFSPPLDLNFALLRISVEAQPGPGFGSPVPVGNRDARQKDAKGLGQQACKPARRESQSSGLVTRDLQVPKP